MGMDIRETFLAYFEKINHERIASAPLVPDDASLLFNNAGMVPFKRIFTGEVPRPDNPRATSCQTCIRAGGKHNDLENVGHTARHHTFFEMLGNFSFGDYFKKEAIAFAWEFLTKELALPVEKLYVTVHESDDEAHALWQEHIAAERIYKMGDKDNFWQMGDTGPCGPCSEIFYDQGAEHFHSDEDVMGGEGDRFLEIWNLVFMQYNRDSSGTLHPLPHPSVDTGMGLERVVAVKEGKTSNYDSSLFMPIIDAAVSIIGKPYRYEDGASYRVIADHIRSCVFLLAQDTTFDKEGRGYVLRRILRRAVRHGYLLGQHQPFMHRLVDQIVEMMRDVYPYLESKKEAIKESILLEEERFYKTIASGITLFNEELAQTKERFSGDVAFKLYDTFGFPLDLTQDMLKEHNIPLDLNAFNSAMQSQRERAKAAWKGSGDQNVEGDFKKLLERFGKNEFIGYEQTHCDAKVLALLSESFTMQESIHAKHSGWVLLDKSPFYAQSGGQIGDSGMLKDVATVTQTKKFFDLNLIHVETTQTLQTGDTVHAIVSSERKEIEKHHSATHLLHAALFEQLGSHIAQAGSSNDAHRLRFDFTHPKALSAEELQRVEEQVNEIIFEATKQSTTIMDVERAKQSGAKAQFGEKYAQDVRVVSFGNASTELCGGTHVSNSADIGMFIITKESGVSAGVRRIEAVCGRAAYALMKHERTTKVQAQQLLKNSELISGIERMKKEILHLKSELKNTQNSVKQAFTIETLGEHQLIVARLESGDIKERIDALKNEHNNINALLFQQKGEKVLMAAGCKNSPLKAGEWIKAIAPIVGGGGGGRPDFAQAGGKESGKINEAIDAAIAYAKKELS